MPNMGLDYGLESSQSCIRNRFRWLFKIPDVSASGINSLPPLRSARPSLAFKEISAEHLNETIYFPGKPDYKPIVISLYDLKKNKHPVMQWLKKLLLVNDKEAKLNLPVNSGFIKNPTLEMYDGCGNLQETWIFEEAWPNNIEFGELDMASSDILTCELTLRFARAYILNED